MRPFSQLANVFDHRPAVIVGGGPSVPEYRDQWPADAIIISANEHAYRADTRVDYVVCNDNIEPKIRETEKGTPGAVIACYGWADYQLGEYYQCYNSGILAAWCAHQMGCCPIIITGMDLYADGTYFHNPDLPNAGRNKPPKAHAMKWQELAQVRRECRGIQIRTLLRTDNLLCDLFDPFDPYEDVQRPDTYEPPKVLELRGVYVRFIRSCKVRSVPFRKDERAYLSKHDAAEVCDKYRKAVRITDDDAEAA